MGSNWNILANFAIRKRLLYVYLLKMCNFFGHKTLNLNYGGFKKLLLLGLGVNTSHVCKPLKKKVPENFQGRKPKCIHWQCWSDFPVNRECGWQERACSSVCAQNTVGLQSSHWVQEPHVTMPTSEQPSCLVVQPVRNYPEQKLFDCCRQKVYNFWIAKHHKVLDWELTKSKGTALDAIILPTSHFSCPLLRGVNRAGLKSQPFFKVLPQKKKKKKKVNQ